MFDCHILLMLLTICRCYGLNSSQYVLLEPFNSHNASSSCRNLDGLIHEVDTFLLSAKVLVSNSLQNVIPIYGLSTSKNGQNPVASKIFGSFSCLTVTRVMRNTCVCVLKQEMELQFLCNVTASCKLSDKMYFFMYFNGTFYNSPSVLNPRIYGSVSQMMVCVPEPVHDFYLTSPHNIDKEIIGNVTRRVSRLNNKGQHLRLSLAGPFSNCYEGKERRVITKPYYIKESQIRCWIGLVHVLDSFNMTAYVVTAGLTQISSETYLSFIVLDNDGTKTLMGMTYSAWMTCSPGFQVKHGVCACVGVLGDIFRVECNFMADKTHSEKSGYFYLMHRQSEYRGEAVRMPKVYAPNIIQTVHVDGGVNILSERSCSQTFRAGAQFTLTYCVQNFQPPVVVKMTQDFRQIALSSNSCTAVNVSVPIGGCEFTFSYIDGCHVRNSTKCVFVGIAPSRSLSTPCKDCFNASSRSAVASIGTKPKIVISRDTSTMICFGCQTNGTTRTLGTETSSIGLVMPAFIIVMALLTATATSYLCYRKRFLLKAKTSQMDTSTAESDAHTNNEKAARPVIEHSQLSSTRSNDVVGQDSMGSSMRYEESSL